jgi:hypothetical protein
MTERKRGMNTFFVEIRGWIYSLVNVFFEGFKIFNQIYILND